MLKEKTLFGDLDRVAAAIETLKDLEPPEGYYVANSGGKDSTVIVDLVKRSGVKADFHHSLTTIDPPEVIHFLREHHPETKIEHPDMPFLQRMATKGFPQRMRRWCCEFYKERGGEGRFVITGIRAAESNKRAGRKLVETCFKPQNNKRFLNIIVDWKEEDVWEYIHTYNVPYCKLYDEGYNRIGCMFCPMARKGRRLDVQRYPRYVALSEKYFEKLYQDRKAKGADSIRRWRNGKEMFDWWINEDRGPAEDPDQTVMFE